MYQHFSAKPEFLNISLTKVVGKNSQSFYYKATVGISLIGIKDQRESKIMSSVVNDGQGMSGCVGSGLITLPTGWW